MREIQSESATEIELSSGGQIAGCAGPAYRLWRSAQCSVPVLVSVPHSGRCYPDAVVSALRDPAQAMLRLEDRYIDVVARPVAAAAGASLMMADAPRAMIDLNRSADDIDWSMVRGEKPRGSALACQSSLTQWIGPRTAPHSRHGGNLAATT